MTWSTEAEASSITKTNISSDDLETASAVLDIYVAVQEDALSEMKPRDIRLLKKAEAFQAAWMKAQIDFLTRTDTDQVNHDNVRYSKGDRDMHVLAPLAKTCINKLSWRTTRTLDALTPEQALILRGKRTTETIGIHNTGSGTFDEPEDLIGGWEAF